MSVVFYHRVSDTHLNDWTISRKDFEKHVDYCSKKFELVGLGEVQKRVDDRLNRRPTVTFTFDDGYAENCDFALPLLAERKIPCVYFVTVDHVIHQRAFAHDVKVGVRLPPNTTSQLRSIADSGIEIGLHSRSHIDFAKNCTAKDIQREVSSAKNELEQIIGCPVRYFAFPFGLPEQLVPSVIDAVYKSGMVGFCSAFGAYNMIGRDSFHIRRFHGDPSFARFRNWLNFDPSKLRNEPAVHYQLTSPSISVENRTATVPVLFDFPSGSFSESSPLV